MTSRTPLAASERDSASSCSARENRQTVSFTASVYRPMDRPALAAEMLSDDSQTGRHGRRGDRSRDPENASERIAHEEEIPIGVDAERADEPQL